MIEPLGDGAFRFPLPEGLDPRIVLHALRTLPGTTDVVVTERYACVSFDPAAPPDDVTTVLNRLSDRTFAQPPRPVITVRVRYDGPDLARVATMANCSPDEVAALHSEREYTVRVVGFLPGFAYLGDVHPRIQVPRLPTPRPRVPAGAIGIAGARTGIYPFDSPGGWNLIATAVDFVPFDPERGATLQLGDRVRFERV